MIVWLHRCDLVAQQLRAKRALPAKAEAQTHAIGTCQSCGARRVPGATECWQCGGTFATLPTPPVPRQRWVELPWVGVIPLGLFFLPWVIASPYGMHRVISIAGLELALGRTLRGYPAPQEPLLWLIPASSLLLAALLLWAHWRTPGPRHWLLVAISAWAPLLLLLIKAVQWLWLRPAPGPAWVVHWLSGEYLFTGLAFFVAGLAAMRERRDARSPHPPSPPSPSHDTPTAC